MYAHFVGCVSQSVKSGIATVAPTTTSTGIPRYFTPRITQIAALLGKVTGNYCKLPGSPVTEESAI